MALLISNAKFKNTTISAPQIYARLQFVAQADGISVNVALICAENKQLALSWQTISTNIPESMLIKLAEGETQDLSTVHLKAKAQLESLNLGFVVTIDLA